MITQALSNKEIAKELFISDQTVSVHRKNIMRKLGVSNTAYIRRLMMVDMLRRLLLRVLLVNYVMETFTISYMGLN